MAKSDLKTITLGVIAWNEEEFLPGLLNDVMAQTYPHDRMEVVLVDGGSTDATRELMQEFANRNADIFLRVVVRDNPKRTQPCGWNIVLEHAAGDVIFRVDAHASIPPDFVAKNMDNIAGGEMVAGGQRLNLMDDSTAWNHTLNAVETSPFGSGAARYRRSGEKEYVKSMFHAAYRKEVFEMVGGFDERLIRTEDNELHYRIRSAGYKLLYDPDVVSYQYTRSNLKKMLQQKYANGYWVGLTVGVCPKCLSLHHFVPFAFLMILLVATVMAAFVSIWPLVTLMGVYFAAAVAMTVYAAVKEGFKIPFLLMPFLFFILHIVYGIGTLIGLVYMNFWKRRAGGAGN